MAKKHGSHQHARLRMPGIDCTYSTGPDDFGQSFGGALLSKNVGKSIQVKCYNEKQYGSNVSSLVENRSAVDGGS